MTMNLTGGMFPTSVHMLRCAIRQFSAESANKDVQISLKTVHGEFTVMSFCGREENGKKNKTIFNMKHQKTL